MTHSLSQTTTLTCPNCRQPFPADIWLIVDTAARPDLLGRIQSDTLHNLSCPRCGHGSQVDAPLLLYRPGETPTLLFSPAQQTTSEQDQEQAAALLGILQQTVGADWQDRWLEQLATVPRSMLAIALNDGLEAAMHQVQAEVAAALEQMRRDDPAAYRELEAAAQQLAEGAEEETLPDEAAMPPLLATLQQFIAADTWTESYHFVQTHPELLGDEADMVLADWVEAAQQAGDDNAGRIFAEHLTLLRRCRNIGVTEAFDEKLDVPPEALAAQSQLEQMPPALWEVLAELAQSGAEIRTPEDLERLLAARPDLQAKLAAASGGGLAVPPQFQADLQRAQAGEQRYVQRGDRTGLDEAAAAWESILNHPDFGQTPDRFQLAVLNDGAVVFLRRYWAKGHLADLNQALTMWQTAVERTAPDSPDLSSLLNNLGNGLRDRYARSGAVGDMEEAIRVYQRAVERTAPDSPDLPGYLNNLGNGLRARYARSGAVGDLEEAIWVYQRAVERTAPDSLHLPGYLSNLGTGLRARYAQSGAVGDLEEAIRVYQRAVERTAPDSPDLSSLLNNLGTGLSTRYARNGAVGDLEEAIRVYQRAVERTAPHSPALPGYLNNLGTGLRARYARSGAVGDLEEAIRVYQRAVERTMPDSPDLSSRLNNLGTGLSTRYARNGAVGDLEEAIRVYQRAVERTAPDSPDLPGYLNNLGTGLRARYARSGAVGDLEEAIRVYEQALGYLDHQFLLSPISFQLGQQQNWAGLFARVVDSYVAASQPQAALAVAEGSKSRLLTTLLGRGRLPTPLALPGELITQEQALAQQLNDLDAAALAQHGDSHADSTLAQRQAVLEKLQSVWQEMGQHGSESEAYVALRRGDRPTWDDLAHLAQQLPPDAAVLSLFTTGDQILLFLLHPDASLHATTADLSLDDFRYQYRNNYIDEVLNRSLYRQTGRPLTHRWRELGKPLLSSLLPHLAQIRHLVIIPEGPLHLLPLHALILDDSSKTLLDHCTVSYVPALSLLDRLLRRSPITATTAAVFGYTHADPQTPEGALERAIFLGEAVAVAQQVSVAPFLDEAASGQTLRTQVADQVLRLLHLSCHGAFAGSDPLHSGVALADGRFTARDFMNLRFRADLVTLSACQTGISRSLGGDEMAGLSQALLYAGASSLLMGLWSVNAVTTAALMTDLYRRLWDANGRKQMSEAQALREATLALRRGELIPANDHIDLTDPYYWAPFVLVGDWR